MVRTESTSKMATDYVKFFLSDVFKQERHAAKINLKMNDKNDSIGIDVLDENDKSLHIGRANKPSKFADEQLGLNEMLFSVMSAEEISASIDGATFYRDGIFTPRQPKNTPSHFS